MLPPKAQALPRCTSVSAAHLLITPSPTRCLVGKLRRPALSTQRVLSGEYLGSGAGALAHSQSRCVLPSSCVPGAARPLTESQPAAVRKGARKKY